MNPTTATQIRALLGPVYDQLVKSYDIKKSAMRQPE